MVGRFTFYTLFVSFLCWSSSALGDGCIEPRIICDVEANTLEINTQKESDNCHIYNQNKEVLAEEYYRFSGFYPLGDDGESAEAFCKLGGAHYSVRIDFTEYAHTKRCGGAGEQLFATLSYDGIPLVDGIRMENSGCRFRYTTDRIVFKPRHVGRGNVVIYSQGTGYSHNLTMPFDVDVNSPLISERFGRTMDILIRWINFQDDS